MWVIAGLMDSKTDINPSGQDRLEILFRVGGFGWGSAESCGREKLQDFSAEMRSGIERLVAKKGGVHSVRKKLLEETSWAVACD